jgi:GSH-dependent disulfide-bond oxidoreductase
MIRRTLVHARSANSLRAAIALELAGAGFERTVLDLAADDQRAALLALHPAGKVPVYVEDSEGERFVLTQSGAIIDHVLREARPELFPVDRRQRASVHASVCAAISDVAVQNALLRYMAFDARNVGFLRDRLLDALRAALAGLADHAFVCGEALTVADVAHYPVVHMRRALLARAGGFGHALDWADRLRTLEPWSRAIGYSGLELPAEIAA